MFGNMSGRYLNGLKFLQKWETFFLHYAAETETTTWNALALFFYGKTAQLHTLYTVLQKYRHTRNFLETMVCNLQKFGPSLLSYKCWLISMGMKQKKKKKFAKKISKWPTQKNWVFQPPPKAEQFLPKFHGLVLGLVGLIDAKGIDVAQCIWSWGCPK